MCEEELYCAMCATVAPFVQLPCGKGHTGDCDCPEWTCARCDAAYLVEPAVDTLTGASRRAA